MVNAEYLYLASLMNIPEFIEKTKLMPKHFSEYKARTIFTAYHELLQTFPEAGYIELSTELHRKDLLKKVGGAAFITEIYQQVPSGAKIEYYEKQIIEAWAVNRLHLASVGLERDRHTKDINELIHDMTEAINEIQGERTQGSVKLNDMFLEWLDSSGNPPKEWNIGIPDIDRYANLKAGELYTVAAGTSVGKSNFALTIMLNVEARIAYINREMSNNNIMTRVLSNITKTEHADIKKIHTTRQNIDQVVRAFNTISDREVYQIRSNVIEDALLEAKVLNAEIVIIDYLQLMKTKYAKDDIYSQISHMSNYLKNYAVENNICIVMLSQFNRGMSKERPTMYQTKGGSDIEQASDVCLILHREEEKLMFGIDKNRNGALTKDDKQLYYEPSTHTIMSLGAF